ALAAPVAADELAGTWVAQDLTVEMLTRQPERIRVLVIRDGRSGLVGRLLVPTLAGVPMTIERQGDRLRLVLSIARGMATPFDATLAGDRLSIGQPGSSPPPSVLRRASD